MPFYDAGEEEVREIVQKEGSFEINIIETHEHLVPYKDSEEDDDETCRLKFGEMMASRKRSITVTMLVAHFGDAIIDRLFEKYDTTQPSTTLLQEAATKRPSTLSYR